MAKKVIKSEVVSMDNEVKVGVGMKVVFVDLKVRGMSMNKKDKARSIDINNEANAAQGTAKLLLQKFPDSFCDPITNAGMGVYQVYKSYGIRVGSYYAVPIKIYPKFASELKAALSKWELAVGALRDAVQTGTLADITKAQQGEFFNPDTLLTVKDVDNTFVVSTYTWKNLHCQGIDDAMAILGSETLEQIEEAHKVAMSRAKIDSELAGVKRISAEVKELVDDVMKKVNAQDKKGVQWKTVVKHIKDAIDNLPNYNVTDNAACDTLLTEMKEKMGKIQEWELKNDENKRKELGTVASDIATKFATMFQD